MKGCLIYSLITIIGIVVIFIFIIQVFFGQIGGKEPPITNQTYEVTYVNGIKARITVKAHEGSPYIGSYKGSYYLDLRYYTRTIFGYKVNSSDGAVNGVLQFKRVK